MAEHKEPDSLDEALDLAADALENGDIEKARFAAYKAVEIAPDSAVAHHYLAAVLSEMGDYNGADREYHEALARSPDDPEILIDACHLILDYTTHPEGLEEVRVLAGRGLDIAAGQGDEDLQAEFMLAKGHALLELGEAEQALDVYSSAARNMPASPTAHLQIGIALFDLVRLEEARESLLRALALDPNLALAHWHMGLVEERAGHLDEADRRFKQASRIDAERFPPPITLTDEEFDHVVEEALERIPEKVRSKMKNLAITCEAIPTEDDLLDEKPPLPPTVLGLFRGHSLREQQGFDPWAEFPASVVLYQRNLERACRTKEELVEQIEITLLHEIGHYLGWDEEDLIERGLD